MWHAFPMFLIGAYLLASIPFGLIISKGVEDMDITKVGSGNIGAANVAREVGLKWGIMTLLADALKGFIPVAATYYFLGSSTELQETMGGLVGLGALLGHQFPVYNRLRGGKGVATGLGVFLAISPISCLFSGMLFLIAVALWRYTSLGSMTAALTMPIWLYVMGHSPYMVALSGAMSLLIIVRHRENIQRLIRGNEIRWHGKPSK
jgi:glycerol-3-phosphate acyltransferase PlsY